MIFPPWPLQNWWHRLQSTSSISWSTKYEQELCGIPCPPYAWKVPFSTAYPLRDLIWAKLPLFCTMWTSDCFCMWYRHLTKTGQTQSFMISLISGQPMTSLPLTTELFTPEQCHTLYSLHEDRSREVDDTHSTCNTFQEIKRAQIVLLWLSILRENFLPE